MKVPECDICIQITGQPQKGPFARSLLHLRNIKGLLTGLSQLGVYKVDD